MFITLFIILQLILLTFMLLHDLVRVPPFNDVDALRKDDSLAWILFSAVINGLFVAIPLYLTHRYFFYERVPSTIALIIVCFYTMLTIGTICAWWIPYIFGSSADHKKHFNKFNNTHHFLPARADNVVPNTLHVVLHLFVWSCWGLSLYFLIK